MEHLAAHLLSITAASIFAAIIKSLFDPKTAAGAMIHLLAGLLVVTTLIRPVVQLQAAQLPPLSQAVWSRADEEVARGQALAENQMRQVISSQLEAYILTEAQSLGAEVAVTFSDWEDLRPGGVTLTGRFSPDARGRMQDKISGELGIKKENQQWIGR